VGLASASVFQATSDLDLAERLLVALEAGEATTRSGR
jgi:hypothetical protein